MANLNKKRKQPSYSDGLEYGISAIRSIHVGRCVKERSIVGLLDGCAKILRTQNMTKHFSSVGILGEITDHKRHRLFAYVRYLSLLGEPVRRRPKKGVGRKANFSETLAGSVPLEMRERPSPATRHRRAPARHRRRVKPDGQTVRKGLGTAFGVAQCPAGDRDPQRIHLARLGAGRRRVPTWPCH